MPREGGVPLGASKRQCHQGTDAWVRRRHHEGDGACGRRREGASPSAPPNANATKAPTSRFSAVTTKVTAPGVQRDLTESRVARVKYLVTNALVIELVWPAGIANSRIGVLRYVHLRSPGSRPSLYRLLNVEFLLQSSK